MTLKSTGIYAAFFIILNLFENLHPELKGMFLQWNSPAFIISIPASVLGSAYVMTIRNPRNYTGFILGIVMAALLSCQFFLQGQTDLALLYIVVFIPFISASLVHWRHQTLHTQKDEELRPAFIDHKKNILTHCVAAIIFVLDYALKTYVIYDEGHYGDWGWQWNVKLLGAITICSSIIANYWMIYKKNDAWLCWVIYCIAGLLLFVTLNNVFSILLFTIMLVINLKAQFIWLRMTDSSDFGWAGSKEYIDRLNRREERLRMLYELRRNAFLDKREQWLLKQTEKNNRRKCELLPTQPGILQIEGHIVDVVNKRLFDGRIYIKEGKIERIKECKVSSKALYIMPGFIDSHIITTDHECTTLEEAQEKLKAGMYVQIRTGSASCDLHDPAPILAESDDRIMFCSDDKYPDEIVPGCINDMVSRCIRRGLPFWSVLNAACVTPVLHYGMECGLLQKGDKADFICVSNLVDFKVMKTFIEGRCVYSCQSSGMETSQPTQHQ